MLFLKPNEIRVLLITVLLGIMVILLCETAKAQNHRPTAISDYILVGESSVAMINLLENDYDVDRDKLKVVSFYYKNKTYKITAGSYTTATLNDTGKLVIYSNGQLQFWPLPQFNGDCGLEGVNYVLSDFHTGGRDTAEIVIHYMDSIITYNDTNKYCMYIPDINGGFKYYPLVKRKELQYKDGEYEYKWKYYFDMSGNLIPTDESIWKRFYSKKVKYGDLEKTLYGD